METNLKKRKIAVIGGGNIGSAIASSLPTDVYDIVCTVASAKSEKRLAQQLPGVTVTRDNRAAVQNADIVLFAVKPYIVDKVIVETRDMIESEATVVSVIAPLTIPELSEKLYALSKHLKIFKAIPNTAILHNKSVTLVSVADYVPETDIDEIMDIFGHSGEAFLIPEKDMEACTAITSCGIAFFLRFIRAAAEGGVELGLRPGFATQLAALTAAGATALLEDGAHPEAEIDKVTTPGGITIKGLNEMEAKGFTAAVIAGIKATLRK